MMKRTRNFMIKIIAITPAIAKRIVGTGIVKEKGILYRPEKPPNKRARSPQCKRANLER